MHNLSQGAAGLPVRNLQVALNVHLPLALPRLAVDGLFGPKTHARLLQFQAANQLRADGIVGPLTQRALYAFVTCRCHLLTYRAGSAPAGDRQRGFVPLPLPLPLPLPPLPRTPLPFPPALPPLPAPLQPPRLTLDPNLLKLMNTMKFELEAGQQTVYRASTATRPGHNEVTLMADLKGIVWSKPLGPVELSTGLGMVVEQRLRATSGGELSVYVFGKAELGDILKLGPLDIAKLEAEAQFSGKPGMAGPADLSLTLTAGPEVKTLGGKLTFGPAGYLEFKTNGQDHTLTPGVKMTGTLHF